MRVVNSRLVDYVISAEAKGFSQGQIYQALLDYGFDADDIREALDYTNNELLEKPSGKIQSHILWYGLFAFLALAMAFSVIWAINPGSDGRLEAEPYYGRDEAGPYSGGNVAGLEPEAVPGSGGNGPGQEPESPYVDVGLDAEEYPEIPDAACGYCQYPGLVIQTCGIEQMCCFKSEGVPRR